MIINLFSSFDPSTNWQSLNWLRRLIPILIIPSIFWLIPSRLNLLWLKITYTLHKEFKILIGNSKGTTLIFVSLFSFILINNFIGLFPYIFTRTRHIAITLTLALPLWLTFQEPTHT
jgi:F-type H+-transporting ATPase subunit a